MREYAAAYSKIMEAWRRSKINRLSWIYIDGYAGPGYHIAKATGDVVEHRVAAGRVPRANTQIVSNERNFGKGEITRSKKHSAGTISPRTIVHPAFREIS